MRQLSRLHVIDAVVSALRESGANRVEDGGVSLDEGRYEGVATGAGQQVSVGLVHLPPDSDQHRATGPGAHDYPTRAALVVSVLVGKAAGEGVADGLRDDVGVVGTCDDDLGAVRDGPRVPTRIMSVTRVHELLPAEQGTLRHDRDGCRPDSWKRSPPIFPAFWQGTAGDPGQRG